MKNLVLGALYGYNYTTIRPFVHSLKKTSFDGEIVLLWNNIGQDTRDDLRRSGVKLVHFNYRGSGAENSWSRFWPKLRVLLKSPCGDQTRRFVYRKILNFAFVRFIHMQDYLDNHVGEYKNVLLTDVRDVIFQDDPFREMLPTELVAFLEAPQMAFGSEPSHNDPWIRTNYDPDTLARLRGRGVSCCGTIMGTADGILEYLQRFSAQIIKLNSIGHGADTSIHNILVREEMKNIFSVIRNLDGAVATLANEPIETLRFNEEGLLLGNNERPIPIIHQYDPSMFQRFFRSFLQ